MTVLHDLGLWLWRLLPANPILVRVVTAGGKRWRHFHARWIYLAVLFVVIFMAGGGFGRSNISLSELAKQSTQTFMYVSLVQLFLMSFIAPIFTAAAITQEKDANTYHILLTTPLSNAQIVLGSLMSRLYFVWVLLLSGLPIFCITMIYGGVTTAEVFQSFALAACTGLVTGALAITISVLKVGTRRTIFSFFVGVAVYLLAIAAYGLSAWGALPEARVGTQFGWRMSWLAPIHPFLALLVVTGQTPPPTSSETTHYGWPASWLLAYPQYGYIILTTLASVAMILVSLFFVRRSTKEGEATIGSRARDFFMRGEAGEKRRKPRRVWSNPIAWREAATRASAGGRSASRWVFIAGGMAAGVLLLVAVQQGWWGITPASAPQWLTALVWIELAVILLVVTNTAATTLTREKESQTMELLLTTPLTSQYIIAGMLQGLVRFVLPLIAVPATTLLLFVIAGLIRPGSGAGSVAVESVLMVPILMIAFAAVAAMVGLQFSLSCKKTVQAVMLATAIVLGASGLLWSCALVIGQAGPQLSALVHPFTPFPAIAALIDPNVVFNGAAATAPQIAQARVMRLISSIVSASVFMGITYSLYKALVRNFDMTVRRQSA